MIGRRHAVRSFSTVFFFRRPRSLVSPTKSRPYATRQYCFRFLNTVFVRSTIHPLCAVAIHYHNIVPRRYRYRARARYFESDIRVLTYSAEDRRPPSTCENATATGQRPSTAGALTPKRCRCPARPRWHFDGPPNDDGPLDKAMSSSVGPIRVPCRTVVAVLETLVMRLRHDESHRLLRFH